ncbi:MAG: hypothetical protein R2838_02080 [Caldilineaceae bacterium]
MTSSLRRWVSSPCPRGEKRRARFVYGTVTGTVIVSMLTVPLLLNQRIYAYSITQDARAQPARRAWPRRWPREFDPRLDCAAVDAMVAAQPRRRTTVEATSRSAPTRPTATPTATPSSTSPVPARHPPGRQGHGPGRSRRQHRSRRGQGGRQQRNLVHQPAAAGFQQ